MMIQNNWDYVMTNIVYHHYNKTTDFSAKLHILILAIVFDNIAFVPYWFWDSNLLKWNKLFKGFMQWLKLCYHLRLACWRILQSILIFIQRYCLMEHILGKYLFWVVAVRRHKLWMVASQYEVFKHFWNKDVPMENHGSDCWEWNVNEVNKKSKKQGKRPQSTVTTYHQTCR